MGTNQDPDFDTYLSYIFRQMTALMSKTSQKSYISVIGNRYEHTVKENKYGTPSK